MTKRRQKDDKKMTKEEQEDGKKATKSTSSFKIITKRHQNDDKI